ncbi:MAG TPA: hypothetical protein VMD30_12560 [Tepidisphaeraceae bacterium]|nr:hypothetical protein [Tepidisphaeraceae bacterium]
MPASAESDSQILAKARTAAARLSAELRRDTSAIADDRARQLLNRLHVALETLQDKIEKAAP